MKKPDLFNVLVVLTLGVLVVTAAIILGRSPVAVFLP